MRLETVAYMRWAKALQRETGLHNLAGSGIRGLLTEEDLGLRFEELPIWGWNEDGLPELREAIAARFSVEPEQVLAAEGTSLANFLALAAWVRPGDPVLLEEPYYEPLGKILSALHARVRTVAVDSPEGHRALLTALKESRNARWRAVVITNPQNPTGALVGGDLVADLASACASQGAILLVDEAYREILLEEPPGCASHRGEAVVTTSSLTKTYGLGPLRIGWAIGPRRLIARAIEIHDNLGVVHPLVAEAIGARLLADPARIRSWRERIAVRVAANRAALATFLDREPALVGGMAPTGILAFPRWKGTRLLPDAETLCARARQQARVAVVPGRFFQRPDRLRIAVGGSEEEVAKALEAFRRFLVES